MWQDTLRAVWLKMCDGGRIAVLTNNKKWKVFRGLAIFAVATAPAFASSIFVNNFSFESSGALANGCGTGCTYSIGAISGWSNTGTVGLFQPGTTAGMFTSLSDGATSAFTSPGTLTQAVNATVGAGTVYTLQVDLGYRLDYANLGQAFTSAAQLVIGGTSFYNLTGTAPGKGTFTTFSVAYTGTLADAGKTIGIQLYTTDPNLQGSFDNVRLSGVPEPGTYLLFGPALLLLGAFRRRRQN